MKKNKETNKQKNWVITEFKQRKFRGCLGGSVGKRPTSAQVMISHSMSLSPTSGFVLTAQSLETALDSVFSSLSASLPPSFSLSKIKKHFKKLKK